MQADEAPKMSFTGKKEPSPTSGFWPMFDVKQLKTAPLVKLRDAHKMYQPVHGSSSGSRYTLVGGNAEVRIAARYTGGQLSVRIEGPGWQKHASAIGDIGFECYNAKDYASMHLAVGEDTKMANKTLGAILLGLGIPLETPLPNVTVFKGVG